MSKREIASLYLVVPCYNEEEIIEQSIHILMEKMQALIKENKIKKDSKVMFVNDGSHDKTLALLHAAAKQNKMISVLSFSKNFGHQSAILAGMMTAREYADAVVTLDADLQQDINALDVFLDKYYEGCEIVYGIRNDRDSDGVFKKATALAYYKLLHWLGCDIMTNHADYRLMSKKSLEALADFKEANLFLRGLVPQLGFQSDVVYFDVKKREAGTSKYTLKKMVALAVNGITSLSIKPLRMISGLGMLIFLFSAAMGIICIVDWANGNTVPGYATSVIVSLIMGGVTLLSLGIIGEYIGKIYLETKERPRYIVESFIWSKEEENDD